MKQYLQMMNHILQSGIEQKDRTGVGTLSVFGHQIRFDISQKFPLVTTKKVYWRGVVHELLWFLKGSTNIKYLVDNDVNIWNEWPYAHYVKLTGDKITLQEYTQRIKNDTQFSNLWGELGPVYGAQWRNWNSEGEYDQIKTIINQIKNEPQSRRIILTAWNVQKIDKMCISGLPPCHCFCQFRVINGALSCHLYVRSWDVFLGAPFNIASYALLTYMLAHVCKLTPNELIISSGDTHIYLNHLEQANTQLKRSPYGLPTLKFNPAITDIDSFTYDDIWLSNYIHYPPIKAPIAV